MITTKQMQYALAVEKTLHFKKAAELCHISQSALSTALAELEKQLGLQVFERDNKRVLVTPVGQQVLKMAREITLRIEELEHLADAQKAPLSYPITIGLIPTIAPYLIPKILPKINQEYPNCQPNIVEDQSHVLVDKVRSGEIDTAILALPYPCEGLLTLEFWQEDFYWVSHKSADQKPRKEINSRELKNSKLMLLREGHCLKDHILDVCKIPELKSNHDLGTSSLNTLIQLVLNKMGSTLIPEMALEQLVSQHPSLTCAHLKEPSPHRRIAFIIRPNYTRMGSIEALITLCKQSLRGVAKTHKSRKV